jgi:hypothetical protein
MEFAVDSLILGIDHFEGVTAITIHVPITIRNASVTKQETDLMGCLRTQADEIPEHVGILEINSQNDSDKLN